MAQPEPARPAAAAQPPARPAATAQPAPARADDAHSRRPPAPPTRPTATHAPRADPLRRDRRRRGRDRDRRRGARRGRPFPRAGPGCPRRPHRARARLARRPRHRRARHGGHAPVRRHRARPGVARAARARARTRARRAAPGGSHEAAVVGLRAAPRSDLRGLDVAPADRELRRPLAEAVRLAGCAYGRAAGHPERVQRENQVVLAEQQNAAAALTTSPRRATPCRPPRPRSRESLDVEPSLDECLTKVPRLPLDCRSRVV